MPGDVTENPPADAETVEDEWMIRSCDVYKDEYKNCRAILSRFHQLFIDGEATDCTQWRRDSNNCSRWTDHKDVKARDELIKSEIARRLKRLKGHYDNDVWVKRKAPPEDWNKPLPERFQKEYENTYLSVKSKEMRGEIAPAVKNESLCVIS